MTDFKVNQAGMNKLLRQVAESPEFLAEGDRQLQAFCVAHRGQDIATIQADFKRTFQADLSDENARLCSEGGTLKALRGNSS